MLRQTDGWSLLSLISDVTTTRKGAGHEINSHTSIFAISWLERCLWADNLADAVRLMKNDSQTCQPYSSLSNCEAGVCKHTSLRSHH